MRARLPFVFLGLFAGLLFNAAIALAWTGPTATAPGNNITAPVNVGTTLQVKNGDLGANSITAFGNLSGVGNIYLVNGSRYLNFAVDTTDGTTIANTTGANGYGIRETGGSLEFKNSGGSWQTLQSIITTYGGGIWTAGTGGKIYYNGGNVGIGTTDPSAKLTLSNNVATGFLDNYSEYQQILYDGGSAVSSYGLGIKGNTMVFNSGAGAYSFDRTGNATAMSIDTSGNVGIGATTLSGKLHVNGSRIVHQNTGGWTEYWMDGSSNKSIYMHFGGDATNEWRIGRSGDNLGAWEANPIRFDMDAPDSALFLNGSGNLGLGGIDAGTTAKLVVSTTGRGMQVSSSAEYGIVGYGPSSGNTYYGVYGASGSYNAALGRADGYSFVGNGTLYNSGVVYANSFLYLSDKRFKENVESLDGGLLTLMKLRPVSFTWKDVTGTQSGTVEQRAGEEDIGFIAQEVEGILPGLVHTDDKGYKSVDYVRLVPILVKAIQEQQKEIDTLKTVVTELQH